MGWGEAHVGSPGTSAQIEEVNTLLDKYGAPPGDVSSRIKWALTDIESKITPVILAIDPSWAPTNSKEEVACKIEDPPKWNCIVCGMKIHGGGEECPCSGYRVKDFNYASLCAHCCEVYDRLMGDKELQAVLKHLFRKYYLEGSGSIIDF